MNWSIKSIIFGTIQGIAIIFVIRLFLFDNNNVSSDIIPEVSNAQMRSEIKEKKIWLDEVSNELSNYLISSDNGGVSNSKTFYYGDYAEKEYNSERLQQLFDKLVDEGWQSISYQKLSSYQKIGYYEQVYPILPTTKILCKNQATVIIYMRDLSAERQVSSTEYGSYVTLSYHNRSPCRLLFRPR